MPRGHWSLTMSSRLLENQDFVDTVVSRLLERMQEMGMEGRSAIGTVIGKDGGRVRVKLDDDDDEEEPRKIGFDRALGVAYEDGDRVAVGYSRSGQEMILANMGGGTTDKRVKNEQLDDGAVDGRALKGGTVVKGHLEQTLEKQINEAASIDQLNNKTKDLASNNKVDNLGINLRNDLANKADKSEIKRLEEEITKLKREIQRADKGDRGKKK